METYETEFLEFALECEALTFGEFVLKSGRRSPYFFNTGKFNTGRRLARLGRFYARALAASGLEYDVLYGPAYKGIPLVSAVGIALWDLYKRDAPYVFNRKEPKDHGEGGTTVGAPLVGRVMIIDDVISAGTSIRESIDVIRAAGAFPVAVVISLDRQERGTGARSALAEIADELALRVISVASLDTLVSYLADREPRHLTAIEAYRAMYAGTP